MERTEHLNRNCRCFFKEFLNKWTIFSNDICEISSGIINPVSVKIHFIIEQLTVKRTKAAESVCREKNTICRIKCHHSLRPVYHRSSYKCYSMFTKTFCISFFNKLFTVFNFKTKLMHKHECFFIADNFTIWIANKNFFHRRCMVRFHMVYQKIIQISSSQYFFHILQKFSASGPVNCVEQNCLFIHEQIGVIGYPSWNRMNILKQMGAIIINTNPVQIFCNFSYTTHILNLLIF